MNAVEELRECLCFGDFCFMVRLCRLSTEMIVAEVLAPLQDSYCNLLHILRRAVFALVLISHCPCILKMIDEL